jgi:hypothetical protein
MWVWAYDARWRFVTRSPDPIDSDELVPNAFMFDGVNKPDALLSASNNCPPGNNTARQTTNGIQSGCTS